MKLPSGPEMLFANDTHGSPAAAHYWAGDGVVAEGRYEVKMLGYNTPPEYLEYVHPYWRSFEAPNPMLNYMLGFFYIFFCFGSVVGNGVVIWVFSTTKSLRTPSNMFVINLALMDFIMMLKTPVFILNSFNDGPVWGKLGCDIYGLMGAFSGVGASTSNAIIAYDRYKTIAKPFEPKFSRGVAIAIIIITWMYAMPWTLLPYFEIWGRFVPEGFLTSCTFDYITEDSSTKSFVASIFFFAYCIPASIIFFSYGQIFSHVSAHEKAMRAQAKKMNVTNLRTVGSKEEQEKSAEIRIAKVAITIFFLFSVSWLPYVTVALITAFGNRSLITPLVATIPACTCKTVACLDPWVYAINHPKYRLELQKRMPWFCIHEDKPSDNTTQASGDNKE